MSATPTQTTIDDTLKPETDQHSQRTPEADRPMVAYPIPYKPNPNDPPLLEIKLPKRRARNRW